MNVCRKKMSLTLHVANWNVSGLPMPLMFESKVIEFLSLYVPVLFEYMEQDPVESLLHTRNMLFSNHSAGNNAISLNQKCI